MTTITVRIDDSIKNRLEKLAKATSRNKSYLVTHAIENYLESNDWQIQEIEKTIEMANNTAAKFVNHEKVEKWLDSWGTDNELKAPK